MIMVANRHGLRHRACFAILVGASALAATPFAARAQDAVIGTATLPRDLSPWGMFLNADPVVKAVLIGLALASVVTWTVWLAKTIEIVLAKRRVRAALNSSSAYAPPRRGSSGLPMLKARS